MQYWDSSAIVPLLVRQSASERALGILQSDGQMLVWWGSTVECVSALARLERERALSPLQVSAAIARMLSLADTWHEVLPAAAIRVTAERLLRLHPLRAADALQLAGVIEAGRTGATRLPFICFDHRLAQAAMREGLDVIGLA